MIQDLKQVFLHGLLAKMKKNAPTDYPTADGRNGSYFRMKNTLNHVVDRLPSGPAIISRAEMETSVSFLYSGKNLAMLHKAIKTGVCHPYLLLLQIVSALSSRLGKLLFVWACVSANKCLDRAYFMATSISIGDSSFPLQNCHFLVLSRRNFPPKDPLVYQFWVWFSYTFNTILGSSNITIVEHSCFM